MATSLTAGRGYGATGGDAFTKATGYHQTSVPRFTPEMMQLFQQLLGGAQKGAGGGVDFLSQLAQGKPETFEQLEAPALRQFSQIQGSLASRFSGMGSGARRSSGFQHETNAAASNLAERLQGERLGLQKNALQQLLGLSQSLLGQQPFENFMVPEKQPFWQQLLVGAAPGASQGAGEAGMLAVLKKLGLLGARV